MHTCMWQYCLCEVYKMNELLLLALSLFSLALLFNGGLGQSSETNCFCVGNKTDSKICCSKIVNCQPLSRKQRMVIYKIIVGIVLLLESTISKTSGT